MTITPRSVQKWVQERVQNDPYNLHAKNPCGFHATLFVQRLRFSPGAPVFSWCAGVGDAGFHVFLPSGEKYVRIMASLSFLLFEKTL